jgi:KDO2-lipid IV(A) lauroyltransferase
LYRISDLLYFIIYYIARYRKKVVFHNLRSAFPDKSEDEIVRLARAFYRHFSDFLLEITKCISISPGELDKRMKFKNPELFSELAGKNQNFALVSAHYNNWEMMFHLPSKMQHRCLIIYRPLKNKQTDRLSLYMRARRGAVMTPMENIYRDG